MADNITRLKVPSIRRYRLSVVKFIIRSERGFGATRPTRGHRNPIAYLRSILAANQVVRRPGVGGECLACQVIENRRLNIPEPYLRDQSCGLRHCHAIAVTGVPVVISKYNSLQIRLHSGARVAGGPKSLALSSVFRVREQPLLSALPGLPVQYCQCVLLRGKELSSPQPLPNSA